MAGRIALSPDIDHELALKPSRRRTFAADALTPREFEVLRPLAEPTMTSPTLHISPKTAANTHYLIRTKLGVASDIELVASRAFVNGSSPRISKS